MLIWLNQLFGNRSCYFCHHKAEKPTYYLNDEGEKIKVCFRCVSYAERRAFKKARR